jgi:hypothetical protein
MCYDRTHRSEDCSPTSRVHLVWLEAYDTVCSMRPGQQNCDLLERESPGFRVTGFEASSVRRLGQTRTAQ